MRKLFIILLILFSLQSFAQNINRKNDNIPKFLFKCKLDSATGWAKDNYGEWKSYKNEVRVLKEDNSFIAYEIYETVFKDKEQVLFIYKFKGSHWKYPTLQQDLYYTNDVKFFLFNKDELNKIVNKKKKLNNSYSTTIDIFISGEVRDYDKKDLLKQIGKNIITQDGFDTKFIRTAYSFQFLGFPVEYNGNNLMRFYFNFPYSLYTSAFLETNIFDSFYFEVDLKDFYNFIYTQ